LGKRQTENIKQIIILSKSLSNALMYGFATSYDSTMTRRSFLSDSGKKFKLQVGFQSTVIDLSEFVSAIYI